MAKNGNLFDTIASKDKPASSKKTNKIAAEVTQDIKKVVDKIINEKAEIDTLKSSLATHEEALINHVYPQQKKAAREGNYSKSFLVEGEKGNLTYTTSDAFSIAKDETVHNDLKKLLGADKFAELFEYKRTITLKETVQNDAAFIQKLGKAVAAAGMTLGDAFEVTDILVAKDGLDQKQFEMSDDKLEVLRTLAKQKKAALK
jgi:hypothetical protein